MPRNTGTPTPGRLSSMRGHPAERALFLDDLPRRLGRQALHALGAFHRSRREAVDADARRPPLDRERPRERIDAGFRRRGMALADRAQQLQRRADVEDHADPLAFRCGNAARDTLKVPFEIDVDDRAEAIRRQVLGQADEVARGAVDEDVDACRTSPTVCATTPSTAAGSRTSPASRERPHAARGNLGGGRLEMIELPAGNRDVAPRLRERERDAAADPRARRR